MSDIDPVLHAWHEVRAELEAACPSAASVALAATNGPWVLPEVEQRHLVHGRCAACEEALRLAWELEDPPRDVLAAMNQLSADGAYGYALREHLGEPERVAAPASIPPQRWQRLVERLGQTVANAFVVRAADPIPLRSASQEADRERTFGEAVWVAAAPGDARRTRVTIDAEELALATGQSLRLVLEHADGEVLADVEVQTSSGEVEIDVDVPAARATSDDVVLVIWEPR